MSERDDNDVCRVMSDNNDLRSNVQQINQVQTDITLIKLTVNSIWKLSFVIIIINFKSVGFKSYFCEFQDMLFLPVIVSIAEGRILRLLETANRGRQSLYVYLSN